MKRAVPQSWGTSNGTFKTNKVGGVTLSFVEYSLSKSIHLTPDIVEYEAGAKAPLYDLIIVEQTLHEIRAVLDFKEKTITIDNIFLPMRNITRVVYQSYTSQFSGIGIIPPPPWLVLLVFVGWYCCTVSFGGNTFLRIRGNSFFEKFCRNSFFSSKGGRSVQKGGRAPPSSEKGGSRQFFEAPAKFVIPKSTNRVFRWYWYHNTNKIPTNTY